MKPQTYKNKPYEDHIRSKPCICCGKESIMHHESSLGIGLVGGGMGSKCSSLAGLPLCPECHQKRHDQGYITFWAVTVGGFYGIGINPKSQVLADGIVMREIIKLQAEWIERSGKS